MLLNDAYSLRDGVSTHVIIQTTMVWKINEIQAKTAEVNAPALKHMAVNKPMNHETTAKNRAIIMNGHMNRDVRK